MGPDRNRSSFDGKEEYSQAFKELFCVAASDLAAMVQKPLEDLGVLYEEIMSTGTIRRSAKAHIFRRAAKSGVPHDIERGMTSMIAGRGQLLFVIRHTSKLESSQLQAAGFRFAAVPNVIEHLSRSMEVTTTELGSRLDNMRKYPDTPQVLESGVHLACFALRPLFQRGFDVLVCRDAKNLLPTVRLPIIELSRWQREFISHMNNWTVASCLERLRQPSQFSNDEQQFVNHLYYGIKALADHIENPFFQDARLTARLLAAPCCDTNGSQTAGQATIVAFRLITDVYQSRTLNQRLIFKPSKFFLCQQHIYKSSPDHEVFARRVHREFAAVVDRKDSGCTSNQRYSGIGSNGHFREAPPSGIPSPEIQSSTQKWPFLNRDRSPDRVNGDNSSEKHLVDLHSSSTFGGIHVSNEVSIDVTEVRIGNRTPNFEMRNLGVYSEAAVAPVEQETFVDQLMALTTGERRQQR